MKTNLAQEMLRTPTYLIIMGKLWSSPDQMATGAEVHKAVAATGLPQTSTNTNTALWRLRDHAWVRSISGPHSNSHVLWVAELSKEEFFASAFRNVLEAFAYLGAREVDAGALQFIEAEVGRLRRASSNIPTAAT